MWFKKEALAILSACLLAFFSPQEVLGDSECSRIITMAPSLTETVYELGLGDNLVGVSSYSYFPASALQVPRVGGLLDPNLEVILSSRPDIVILLREQADLGKRLSKLGLVVLSVHHGNISGILNSLTEIGDVCGVQERARVKRQSLEERILRVQQRIANFSVPRVMMVVGVPEPGAGLGSIFVSGDDGFYHEMLERSGGQNAHSSRTVSIPMVSPESLMAINPEVIVHIATERQGEGLTRQDLIEAWQGYFNIDAVSDNRIHLLSGSHVVVPGPRFIDTLEELASILHPDKKGADL